MLTQRVHVRPISCQRPLISKKAIPPDELSFFEFANHQIDLMRGRVAQGTLKGYRSEIAKLQHFNADLKLTQLNWSFMRNYECHLRTIRNNSHNTVWKTVKTLRSLLTIAVDCELINRNPLSTYEINYKQPDREFLSKTELKKLYRLYMSGSLTALQAKVLRAFLFSCHTGLRFSDIKALQWSNVKRDRLIIKQGKTGKRLTLPLNENALALLADLEKSNEPKVFRLPCNYKANKRLKGIFLKAGIRKQITFHCSRHTFATLALNMGMPIRVVQELLGHESPKSTEIYARLVEPTLFKEMRKLDRGLAKVFVIGPKAMAG
jgi:integrase